MSTEPWHSLFDTHHPDGGPFGADTRLVLVPATGPARVGVDA